MKFSGLPVWEVPDEHHGELCLERCAQRPEVLPLAAPPPGCYSAEAQPADYSLIHLSDLLIYLPY